MNTARLELHGFETSNNIKVRVALGYKELEYAFHPVDPRERAGIVELSGQHLTPVLAHGDVVLFDSAAILRYLDANFPGTPKLFGSSRDEQWEVEDWEFFGRTQLAGPMMEVVHRRVSGGVVDDAMSARCADEFAGSVEKLTARLAGREWLVGNALSAADIGAAAVLYRVQQGALFELPPAVDLIAPWRDRVMAFDGPGRQP